MAKKKKRQQKKRKVPMRKDVVSGGMFPKKELVRIVKTPDNDFLIDPSGKMNGHGAYIGLNIKLAKKAKENKILNSIFGQNISEKFYDHLIEFIGHQQARKELFSHERIIKTKNS